MPPQLWPRIMVAHTATHTITVPMYTDWIGYKKCVILAKYTLSCLFC